MLDNLVARDGRHPDQCERSHRQKDRALSLIEHILMLSQPLELATKIDKARLETARVSGDGAPFNLQIKNAGPGARR